MSSKSEYEAIFNQRGKDYDLAMQRYPNARDKEFERLFDGVNLQSIKLLADVPAGGGYLGKFLPEDCEVVEVEPCADFEPRQAHAYDVGLDDIELGESAFDMVVCLAAIHHVHKKPLFVSNLYKALKPGGYLLIGDVDKNTSIPDFLDGFAGQHNGTGHKGQYLDLNTIDEIVKPLGAIVHAVELRQCLWVFDNEEGLLEFTRLLFGLRSVENEALLSALQGMVGVNMSSTSVELGWQLLYHCIQKPA